MDAKTGFPFEKALAGPGISFICDGAEAKPLAYLRSFEEEKILVALNPTGEDQILQTEEEAGDVIYSLGELPEISKGKFVIRRESAVFISLR